MLLFLSVNPVSHLNMAVVHLFFLRRNFNISSIKAKRAVNRMHCVVQIVIGGGFQKPCRDIKAMQIAGVFVISGSVISVSSNLLHQTKIMRGCQAKD